MYKKNRFNNIYNFNRMKDLKRTLCLKFCQLSFKLGLLIALILVCPVGVNASFRAEMSAPADGNFILKGTVIYLEDSEPVIGVTVSINGKPVAITNENGSFLIKDCQIGTMLTFSYIGMRKQTVKVKGSGSLKIVLEPDSYVLNEVVAIGYGEMKRSDLTGSVSSITSKTIEEQNITTIDQALQGRIAGLNMAQNTGTPGSGTSITIRGAGSIQGSTQPIFVVDGVVITSDNTDYTQNPLAGINPADIESIEVLRDASATAIYGSQAANGVILVSLKKGKRNERTSISFSSNFGFTKLAKKYDILNLEQYATYLHNYLSERILVGHDATSAAQTDEYQYYSHPELLSDGYDWQDIMFKKGFTQSYNLALRGGGDKSSYSASGSYEENNGSALGALFQRFTLRSIGEIKPKSWLTIGLSTNFYNSYQEAVVDAGSQISNALRSQPYLSPDAQLSYNSNNDGHYSYNPFAQFNATQKWTRNFGVQQTLYAEVRPVSWLKYRVELNGNFNFSKFHYYLGPYVSGYSYNSSLVRSNRDNHSNRYTWKNILTADKRFKDDHKLTLMLGSEYTEDSNNYSLAQRTEYYNPDTSEGVTDDNEISAGDPSHSTAQGQTYLYRMFSFFGRAFYSFKDRYLFTATIRQDGTSRFGDGNKWGTFPSFAFAWRLSEEPWFKKQSFSNFINNAKLRLSWGLVGNSNVGDFQYVRTLSSTTNGFGQVWSTSTLGNPDLKWESTNSYNAGLDLDFFRGKLQIVLEAYYKKTNNLLLQLSLPGYMGSSNNGGYTSPYYNIGSITNKGIELTINSTNISNNKFTWRSNLTFSKNINEVTSLNIGSGYFDTGSYWRTAAGHPVGQFYGYVFDGRINSAADFLVDNGDGTSTVKRATTSYSRGTVVSNTINYSGTYIGDYLFKDLNSDGVLDSSDRTYLGNPFPKFTIGLNNSFSYKGFDWSFFLYASVGGKIYNYTRYVMEDTNSQYSNKATSILNAPVTGFYDDLISYANIWNVYVTNAKSSPDRLARLYRANDINQNSRTSTAYIENGSYLRLKDLSVGYTLPKKYVSMFKISRMRVFARMGNVLTITGYSGYDPEVGYTPSGVSTNGVSSVSMTRTGVDSFRNPSPRTYSFGLDIGL
jgi:TonB-dependent starch-binding outer membrane protein SusC